MFDIGNPAVNCWAIVNSPSGTEVRLLNANYPLYSLKDLSFLLSESLRPPR